jgi:hypothetical protein
VSECKDRRQTDDKGQRGRAEDRNIDLCSLFHIMPLPYSTPSPRLFQFPFLTSASLSPDTYPLFCSLSQCVSRMTLHPVSLFYAVAVITSTITVADPGGDCSKVSSAACFNLELSLDVYTSLLQCLAQSQTPVTQQGSMALTTHRLSWIYRSSSTSARIHIAQRPPTGSRAALQAPVRQSHAEKTAKYMGFFSSWPGSGV